MGGHLPPLYKSTDFKKTISESKSAFEILGVKNWKAEQIPATTFNNIPVADFNKLIESYVKEIKPDTVFIPFPDRHIDHRITFEGSMVACRPISDNHPKLILAYETLSETYWNASDIEPSFVPNFFIDISNSIQKKIDALRCYHTQINRNLSRSVVSVNALSVFRGSQNGCANAEAFKLVRLIV